MDQQPQSLNTQTPSLKGWGARDTIVLIFLILFPIIGLILMWAITQWDKKVKLIVTAVIVLIPLLVIAFLSLVVTTSLNSAREDAQDARKDIDVRQILIAQELYYGQHGQYYRAAQYPSDIPGTSFTMPIDPSFGWIDNTQDPEKFCVYAALQNDTYFIASHSGYGQLSQQPRTLLDCENL